MENLTFRSSLSDHAWPAVPGPMGGRLLALQYQLERTERMLPDQRAALCRGQLEKLLTHAHDALAFWRVRLSRAGWRPGVPVTQALWSSLPILSRAEAQAAGTRLHCLSPPTGHGKIMSATTSGSTGRPLTALKTELAMYFWHGAVLREALWHDMDLDGKLAIIRRDHDNKSEPPDGCALPGWGPSIGAAIQTGPAAMLDIRSSAREQLAWLVRENPAYVRSWPSNLLTLARAARAAGAAMPGLRAVCTFGEAVSEEVREACRAAWGVGVIDAYTAEEVGYIALQCPAHEHYHVLAENVLLEVLDEAGAPCAPGQAGRVVLTPLHNYAMPLIRYEIGDYAEPGRPCDCGRTLPVLSRILGRVRNQMMLPNGERRAVVGLGDFTKFTAGAAIQQYQLAQTARDTLELRLVTGRALTQEECSELIGRMQVRFGKHFSVDIVYHTDIPRSASGKYEDFVCELP